MVRVILSNSFLRVSMVFSSLFPSLLSYVVRSSCREVSKCPFRNAIGAGHELL